MVFVDTPGVNNGPGVLSGNLNSTVFTPSNGSIRIPAGGTALIAVLPSAFPAMGPAPLDPTPLQGQNFEVRGYVRLRLPTILRSFQLPNGKVFFSREAQAAAPVRVMLTPQNRAVYYGQNGTLSDQTQSSLPTTSGAAVNLLPPDPPLFFVPGRLGLDPVRLAAVDRMVNEEDRGTVMAAMLASIDDKADVSAMNAALAEAGIGFAVERRKLKG